MEENASEGSISYSKLVTNDINIEVTSGGVLSDTATGNILSSVYFDTYLEADPQTRIIKDGQTMIESNVNYWEKEE